MRKATTKPKSINQGHRSAAARTEEDKGSEVGFHETAGEAPPLLRRKGADIIHDDYWVSDGPARQKEDEEEVGMWWWYKRSS